MSIRSSTAFALVCGLVAGGSLRSQTGFTWTEAGPNAGIWTEPPWSTMKYCEGVAVGPLAVDIGGALIRNGAGASASVPPGVILQPGEIVVFGQTTESIFRTWWPRMPRSTRYVQIASLPRNDGTLRLERGGALIDLAESGPPADNAPWVSRTIEPCRVDPRANDPIAHWDDSRIQDGWSFPSTLLQAVGSPGALPLCSGEDGRSTFSLCLQDEPAAGPGEYNGVAYVNGEIFVTRTALTPGTPHQVLVFGRDGRYLRTFDQLPSTAASAWGWRDGASDGHYLLFGRPGGVDVVDSSGARQTTLRAANGLRTVPTPIASAWPIGNYRAVAFDPTGNGGEGSIFVADLGPTVFEVPLNGHIGSPPHVAYPLRDRRVASLVRDPVAGTLWIGFVGEPDVLEFRIDRSSPQGRLLPTGDRIAHGDSELVPAGLDHAPGGLDGRDCGHDLLVLEQGVGYAKPDCLRSRRLHLWDGFRRAFEAELQVGVNGVFDSPIAVVSPFDQTLAWNLDVPGLNYVLLIDAVGAPLRAPGPIGPFKSLWELILDSPLANPASRTIEFGVLTSGVPTTVPVSALAGIPLGTRLRSQAVYIEPRVQNNGCGLLNPFAVTNPTVHDWQRLPYGIEVVTAGLDTFNADSGSGLFSVATLPEFGGSSILSMTMELAGNLVFDTDERNMAGEFWNGNATACSAGNTYRNRSDSSVGLDYAHAWNNLSSLCAGTRQNAGCEAWRPIGSTGLHAFGALTWRFIPGQFRAGKTFEFDCDVDAFNDPNHPRVGGADLEGTQVTFEIDVGGGQIEYVTGYLLRVGPVTSRARF